MDGTGAPGDKADENVVKIFTSSRHPRGGGRGVHVFAVNTTPGDPSAGPRKSLAGLRRESQIY